MNMDHIKLYGAKDQLGSFCPNGENFSGDIQMSFGLDKCAVLEIVM